MADLPAWLGLFAIIVFLARFSNINYLSLHRYYRDRLMETFLPNVPDALDVMGPASFAETGFLAASIRYAKGTENENTRGTLIYLKTTFFDGLSADLRGYRAGNPDFPDQSTGDQFFDEKQFEAYRELGFQTARAMMLDQKGRRFGGVVESLGVPRID